MLPKETIKKQQLQQQTPTKDSYFHQGELVQKMLLLL